jgi:hypothetical protein
MTPEQFVTILGAVTALLIAVTGLYVQVTRLHQQVNSRMTELLSLTRSSAHAEGVIDATAAGSPELISPHGPRPGESAST